MLTSMLTTVDNPFDPFDAPDAWEAWDRSMGYNTSNFLARLLMSSEDLSDRQQHFIIEDTIDEIVRENVTGMYKKVVRDIP